jgi:hypothetical protein
MSQHEQISQHDQNEQNDQNEPLLLYIRKN